MNICKDCKDVNKYNNYLRKKSNWVEHPRFLDIYNEGNYYNCSNCKYNKDIDKILKIKDNQLKDRIENGISNPIELKQSINTLKKNCMLLAIPFRLKRFFSEGQIKIIKRYKLDIR